YFQPVLVGADGAVSGKRQAASGKRQAVSGKRQAASGKRQTVSGKQLTFNGRTPSGNRNEESLIHTSSRRLWRGYVQAHHTLHAVPRRQDRGGVPGHQGTSVA